MAKMSIRPPTLLARELLRPFQCRSRNNAFQLHKSPARYSPLRSFTFTQTPLGLFSRSSSNPSTSPPPPPPTATPIQPVHPDSEPALTSFQEKIAALETTALQNPSSLSAHLELLRALLEGGEYAGLTRYYQTFALGEERIDELLRSEEAWGVHIEALGRGGRLGEVAGWVRRRDGLLAGLGGSIGRSGSVDATSGTSVGVGAVLGAAAAAATPSSSVTPSSTATTTSASTASPYPSNPTPQQTHSPLVSSLLSSPQSTSPTTATHTTAGPNPGSPLAPLYVQLAPPSPQTNAWKALRWLLGFLLWGFILLTILSMVMENTGLLKAGQGPAEFEPEEGKIVRFSDVHGVEEAKGELEEVVEFLKNPDKFSSLGGKLPKGVLLTGPPGTGKTLLARAVAGEAGVPFLFASGSSFEEMFVGVGAKRVRDLFTAAKKKSPAIVFIDELDAIGSKRSARDQHYMKQTLNQLLVELDGFEQNEGVIIIAATNFPESLDPALTRPGRFDRHVTVGLPDVRGRIAILKHHMTGVQYDVDVDPSIIARGTPGLSGADLQNLVNQAAVKASREGMAAVELRHFEWAKDRILMGAERRSHYVTEKSKRETAYHEAGHALAALHTPGALPLHKVTIMPRGHALGITFQLPEQDKDSYSRREFSAMIDVALGGRAAEEMILGREETTSGCSSDLVKATNVATRMIREYGFSDKVGLTAFSDQDLPYLSSAKKDQIEGEIRSFVDEGMKRAAKLLKDHEEELHVLAGALVEYEELNLEEVRQVLKGEKLDRPLSEGDKLMGAAEKMGAGEIVEGI